MDKDLFDFTTAHLLQEAANLRLKDNDQGDKSQFHRIVQHKTYHLQLQQIGNAQSHHDQQNGLDDLAGPTAADKAENMVHHEGHNGHIQHVKKADQLHILLNGAQELLNIFHFIASNHMAKCHSMAILRIIAHKRRIGKTMTAKTSNMKQI